MKTEAERRAAAKYRKSEKNRACQKKWSQSQAAKEAKKRYWQTEKGKASRQRIADRAKERGYYKNWRLLREYGISLEQYQGMLVQQLNRCAICHGDYKLFVDHDHNTGRVRGLLCTHCNRGLGGFKDNPDFLQTAMSYLGGPSVVG